MIVLALPHATAKTLSSPSSPIISVHFIPSSSQKKVIKVETVALLFQPEEDIIWELRFCFGFHASHAHLGVGGLTLWDTCNSCLRSGQEFRLPYTWEWVTQNTQGRDVQALSRVLESCPEAAVRDWRSRFSGTAALLPSGATTGQDQENIQALSRTKPAADTHNSWDKSLPTAVLGPTPSWVWVFSLKPTLVLLINFKILF